MAQVADANQNLYVVERSVSSSFFVIKSEKYLDENAKKSWYKYSEPDRKKIGAIRQKINVVVNAGCAQFYTMKIANDVSKKQIEDVIALADVELKAIDPTLKAEVIFPKLDGGALTSGTMLDKMIGQIRNQILKVAIHDIEKNITKNANSGALPEKMRVTLNKMLDRVKAVNVIGDEGINQQIDAMKERIGSDPYISTLRNEILSLLDNTKSRFEGIDMRDNTTSADTAIIVEDVSIEDSDDPTTEPTTEQPATRTPSRFAQEIEI